MEENLQNVSGEVVDNTDYITAIKELKEKSVDRAKYDSLQAEKKALLDALVNGQPIQEEQPKKVDINELRNSLFNEDNNNLQYVTKMVELRDALISKGEPDPFLPWGKQIAPDANDVQTAEKVAQVFKECIEYADGDSQLFTQELQRRTNTSIYDNMPKVGKRR